MKPVPGPDEIHALWAEDYGGRNYDKGLAAKILYRTHAIIEKPLKDRMDLRSIIEVGAGSGIHTRFVRHPFDTYLLTDRSDVFLKSLQAGDSDLRIQVEAQDALHLDHPDSRFDRLIATHVLEHLPDPANALAEWHRVVRNDGVISLILPCDPGLLWRVGRNLGPRKAAESKGMPYDYVMAREHINPIGNLKAILEYHFEIRDSVWWPSRIPLYDLNLIWGINLVVRK